MIHGKIFSTLCIRAQGMEKVGAWDIMVFSQTIKFILAPLF